MEVTAGPSRDINPEDWVRLATVGLSKARNCRRVFTTHQKATTIQAQTNPTPNNDVFLTTTKPHMKTCHVFLSINLRPSLFFNSQPLKARRTFMMTTRLSSEPRRFAPLAAEVDKEARGLPGLKGIVFDVDGTLW